MLQISNGGVVGEFSRLQIMGPSVRPIERAVQVPRMDSQSTVFPAHFVAPELHDAHGEGRLAVVCQDEFGDPETTAANDLSHSKPLFARLTGALVLYVVATAGSLT